ncbi:MAG: phosphate ABC transporter substrate-binding protein [Anaerolineae bacterium]
MQQTWTRRLLVATAVCFLVMPTSACAFRRSEASGLVVAGSTSVQPFAELLAEQYARQHPGEPPINVQGGGSTAGIEAVQTSAADIGMSSRDLKDAERAVGLLEQPIAYDAIAIVVHPSNPVRALTSEQVRAIFSGDITSWAQVGGPDTPIIVVTREEGSGTRGAFEEMLMEGQRITDLALRQDSNGAVRVIVSSDKAAIGYMSLGIIGGVVTPVALDGVVPTVEAALAGQYLLVRPFLFVFSQAPGGEARAFLDYCLSLEGQDTLQHEGLIPVESS